MRTLRWIEETELEPWVRIVRDSFAGVSFPSVEEHMERTRERMASPETEGRLGAVFEGQQMVATYRVHAFTANVFGQQLPMHGLGGVATALDQRGRGIARELVERLLDRAREDGTYLATLYPFRPSFYGDLGYGPGTPMQRFQLDPRSFPSYVSEGETPCRVVAARAEHHLAMEACYLEIQGRTHGLLAPRRGTFAQLEREGERIFVALRGEQIVGFLVLRFRHGVSALDHDAEVVEWHGVDGDARRALFGFLRGLRDQVGRVELSTQDEDLHVALRDPMDGSRGLFHLSHPMGQRAWGIMYRVLDLAGLFGQLAQHDFQGVDLRLAIDLTDPLFLDASRRTVVIFEGGRPRVGDPEQPWDARLEIGVAALSSLLLGAVRITSLLDWGQARLEGSRPVLEQLFRATDKPRCSTMF